MLKKHTIVKNSPGGIDLSIIDEEKLTFYDAYESFCYQNCQRQILEYYKVKDALFYINSSRSFIIRKQMNHKFTIDYDLSAKSILPSYDDNVKRIFKETRNCYDVWKDNLSLIQKDFPLIVGVDSYYLEYLPFYKKSHGKHTIILSGYDDNEEVDIVDWFSPWFFKGKVAMKQFLDARDSNNDFDGGIYSGRPIYNNWAVISRDGGNADRTKLIKETIDISIKQYYAPDRKEPDAYYGINAISYLLDMLAEIIDNQVLAEDQKEFLRVLYNNIYLHNRRNYFFKFYLEQACKLNGYDSVLNDAVNEMNTIYEQWEKWLYLGIKCQYKVNENNMNRLLSNMKNMYEIEKNYEDVLRKVSDKL